MQRFCPLCMKNGVTSRMKGFQINMEEAVWSCERSDCIWPFGYQDPIFFQRSAMTCNWDDCYFNEESTLTLPELSLYTPPMTPREETFECSTNSTVEDKCSESISSKRESTDCNKLSLELANNKLTKEKDINRNPNKQLPEIVNIKKVNINVSKFLQHKRLDNEKMQKHLYATSTMDIAADSNALSVNTECNDFSLHTQCKTEKELSDNVQANELVTCLGANTNINIPTTITSSKADIANNSDTINYSILDDTGSSDLSLDTILNSIMLDNISDISKEIDDDSWLDLIQF